MKTWEMIQHSGKKFKRKSDGFVIEIAPDGTLYWDSGHRFLNTNDEWEEVKEPVTWEVAFKAGLEGKMIKPEGQYLTFRDYRNLNYVMSYLSERPEYYKNIMLGNWYIED